MRDIFTLAGVFAVLVVVSHAPITLQAQEPDVSVSEMDSALSKTQADLNNPEARRNLVEQNARSQAADANLRSVVGSGKGYDQSYHLTGDILSTVAHQANGNPEVMQKMIENAAKDPEGFFRSLNDDQKKQISDLAAQSAPATPSRP